MNLLPNGKVAALRYKHNLSQREFARMIGMNRTSLAMAEIYERSIPKSIMIKIAKYFKKPLRWFYEL